APIKPPVEGHANFAKTPLITVRNSASKTNWRSTTKYCFADQTTQAIPATAPHSSLRFPLDDLMAVHWDHGNAASTGCAPSPSRLKFLKHTTSEHAIRH